MSVVAKCLHKRFPSISDSLPGLYEPIFEYFNHLSDSHAKRPLIVGISAPQGCGKTTLTNVLVEMFDKRANKKCVVLSMDDFYLTGADQEALSQRHASNPLLKHRGSGILSHLADIAPNIIVFVAGTHDLALAHATLEALQQGHTVHLPRYDKSLREGRGDRAPVSSWPEVCGVVDVVLLEGWMLAFEAVSEDQIALSTLSDDNKACIPDTWLLLSAQDIRYVYKWRQQAETAMIASGRAGMSADQVRDFVDRFMPSYELYLPLLPTLLASGHKNVFHVTVNEQREPVDASFIR